MDSDEDQPSVDTLTAILEIDADGVLERQTIQEIIDIDRDSATYAPFKLLMAEMAATIGSVENTAAVADLRAKSNEINRDIEQIFNNECAPEPVESDDWRRRLEQLHRKTKSIALDNALESFGERAEYLVKIVTYLLTMPRADEASLDLLLNANYVAMAARLWKKTQTFCVYVYRLLSPSTLIKSTSAVVALLLQLEEQMAEVYEELALCWEFATTDRDQMLAGESTLSQQQQQRSIRSSTRLCHYAESLKRQVQSKVRKLNASRSESPSRATSAFAENVDDDDETSFAVPDISMDEFERASISSSAVGGSILNLNFIVNCMLSLLSFLFTISRESSWHITWQAIVNGVLGDLTTLTFGDPSLLQRAGIAATGVAVFVASKQITNWPVKLAILASLGAGSLLFGTQTIIWLLFGSNNKPPDWFVAYEAVLIYFAQKLHWTAYLLVIKGYIAIAASGATTLSALNWFVNARAVRTEKTLMVYTKKKIVAGFKALAEYQNRHRQPLLLAGSTTERRQSRMLLQASDTAPSRFNNDERTRTMLREVREQEEAARREQEALRLQALDNQALIPLPRRQQRSTRLSKIN